MREPFKRCIDQKCDLDDNKFLNFWLENRLIKVNKKDKIKCWRQLGQITVLETVKTDEDDPTNS